MKIISKFKDFYDYKVAKYGVDEKLIYNRKTCYDYYKIRFQYRSSDLSWRAWRLCFIFAIFGSGAFSENAFGKCRR